MSEIEGLGTLVRQGDGLEEEGFDGLGESENLVSLVGLVEK